MNVTVDGLIGFFVGLIVILIIVFVWLVALLINAGRIIYNSISKLIFP